MSSPRAFLCHGTQDQEIYVKPFGEYLATRGIDPWVDSWAMQPGNSLLPMIENGIGDADFFLPFLSPRSLGRPWVQSEIEMAVARKLLNKLKIIPMLIDVSFTDIPLFLQTLVGIKIDGEEGITAAAQKAVDAIYGLSSKPIVAPRPAYAATPSIPGLSPADMAFLRAACEYTIQVDQSEIDFENVAERLNDSALTIPTMKDSVAVLDEKGYVKKHGVLGDPFKYLDVRPTCFDTYASQFIPDYGQTYRRVAAAIAFAPDYNPGVDAGTISRDMKLPHRLVNHIYEHLAMRGKIKLSRELCPSHSTETVSPSFRREMTNG
jgi:TIR domain